MDCTGVEKLYVSFTFIIVQFVLYGFVVGLLLHPNSIRSAMNSFCNSLQRYDGMKRTDLYLYFRVRAAIQMAWTV